MQKELFEVRDNELDAQGVVNNANYFVYMAHARHKYADILGINFHEMAQNKQYFHLINSNIDYKKPLMANDKFYVSSILVPEGKIRFAFKQEIYKITDSGEILIATGYNTCVCINGNTNRPYIPEQIAKHFS